MGFTSGAVKPDFLAALERMRRVRAELSCSFSVQMLADRGIKHIDVRQTTPPLTPNPPILPTSHTPLCQITRLSP